MGETSPMAYDVAHLDALQGDREKRNEPYKWYGDVSIAASQHGSAPKISSTNSCADRQGDDV